jgi:formylglycine-generating enzyme required for sulfatase activity
MSVAKVAKSLLLCGIVVSTLASCVTAASGTKPVLAQLPAWVSPGLAGGADLALALQQAVGEELERSSLAVWRRPGWFEAGFAPALAATDYAASALLADGARARVAADLGVTHLGLLDVLRGPSGKALVSYRVVEASSGRVAFFDRSLVAAGHERSWAAHLALRWALDGGRSTAPLAADSRLWASWWATAPDDAVTRAWIARMPLARPQSDFREMQRLADLLQDRAVAFNSAQWSASMVAVQAEVKVQQTLDALAQPFGDSAAESLLEYRLLEQLRAPWAAASRPSVAVAFVGRFGESLAAALARHPMLPVPGGKYVMGSAEGNPDESPVHPVTVSPFLMGRTEVTQEQYRKVMGTNPSLFTKGDNAATQPVERVTWYDAVAFCNKLSSIEGLPLVYTVVVSATGTTVTQDRRKTGYRLPTEAEWEYAARGGSSLAPWWLAGDDDPTNVAWTDGRSASPVATLEPNALGLYDLSGNVWEWCWDWYGKYTVETQNDPEGPTAGVLKVGRGGSWRAAAWNARVSSRSYDGPGAKANILGFRVVRSITPAATP